MSRPRPFVFSALLALVTVSAAGAATSTIAQVLGPGVHGDAGGVGAGTALFKVRVDLEKFPDARCNDGSAAVFYVRAASRAEDRDKWIIYLQGGGSCQGYQSCADRWLSRDSHYGANKMSTTAFPPPAGIRGGGILSPERGNALRGWNAVFAYYCSSDSWTGQADAATLQDTEGGPPYSLHFHGAAILDALIAELNRSTGVVRYDKNPNPAVTRWVSMPDLRQATDVLFTGASAGSNGVKHHADRLGEELRSTNLRCAAGEDCPLRYRAVMDAAFGPAGEGLDWNACTAPNPCAGQTYESFQQLAYQQVWLDTWEGRMDASCLAWHGDPVNDPAQEVWRCSDPQHVARNHVTTPYFARMDLLDDNALPWSFGSDDEFAQAVHDGLEELAALDLTAEEGGDLQTPGVYGPKCGQHVGLDDSQAYHSVRVWNESRTTSHTYQDILLRWLAGTEPRQWIEQDATGRIWPRCSSGAVPCCP